jgi:hypothetical protein
MEIKMEIKYIGENAEVQVGEYVFKNGEYVDVYDDAICQKLSVNPMFEVKAEEVKPSKTK